MVCSTKCRSTRLHEANAVTLNAIIQPIGTGSILAIGSLAAVSVVAFMMGAVFVWTPHAIKGVVLLGLLSSSVFEELMFRGPLFTLLRRKLGPGIALAITSLAFGGVHWWNPGMSLLALLNVTLAGVLLGIIVLRTESIAAAISFHVVWNLAVATFCGSVSGLGSQGWISTISTKQIDDAVVWMVSGPFGIEQGLITTIILLAAIVVTNGWVRPTASALRARIQQEHRQQP